MLAWLPRSASYSAGTSRARCARRWLPWRRSGYRGQDAGVSLCRGGSWETVTATSQRVRATDRVQFRLRRGPCVDALRAATVVTTCDVRTDSRWPEFGRQVHEATTVVSLLPTRCT